MESLKATVASIREGLDNKIPYITGVVPLEGPQSKLFYSTAEVSGHVDFSKATAADLEQLARACQPATFGLNQENVYDESYRKALKMDTSNFAMHFNPIELGIEDIIKQKLVQKDGDPDIRFELYKLNVYGPGSFFKSHVDTPRGQSMFGSLVVVLPTAHTGGSLNFRHNNQEWAFDSASATCVDPCTAAFTAFFSDVEHEVTPVLSGYRVTITYNLYFAAPTDPKPPAQSTESTARIHSTSRLRNELGSLINSDLFLPNGGYIGVHLIHKYPFDDRGRYFKLESLERYLKGVDGDVLAFFRELKLDATLKMLYSEQDGNGKCLTDKIVEFDYLEHDEEWAEGEKATPIERYIYGEWNGKPVISTAEDGDIKGDKAQVKYRPIFWLRGDVKVQPNHKETYYKYTAGGHYYYGNEADWSVYEELALVARIGPAGQRETLRIPDDKGEPSGDEEDSSEDEED